MKIDFRKGSGTFVLGYMMMIVSLFICIVLIDQYSKYGNALNTQMAVDSISDGVASYSSTLRGMDEDEMYEEAKDRADTIAQLIAEDTAVNDQEKYEIHEQDYKENSEVAVYLTANYKTTSDVSGWGIDDGTDNGKYSITRYATTVFTNHALSDYIWPSTIIACSSPFGWRVPPTAGATNNHQGIDLGAPIGTPMYAVGDGTVSFNSSYGGGGMSAFVKLDDTDITEIVMHCSSFASNLHDGDHVKKGDIIAYSGNTGVSTGPHFHFTTEINGVRYNPLYCLYGGSLENIKLPNNSVASISEIPPNSKGTTLLSYEYYDAGALQMVKPDGTRVSY